MMTGVSLPAGPVSLADADETIARLYGEGTRSHKRMDGVTAHAGDTAARRPRGAEIAHDHDTRTTSAAIARRWHGTGSAAAGTGSAWQAVLLRREITTAVATTTQAAGTSSPVKATSPATTGEKGANPGSGKLQADTAVAGTRARVPGPAGPPRRRHVRLRKCCRPTRCRRYCLGLACLQRPGRHCGTRPRRRSRH
jgi:hypothetical protein